METVENTNVNQDINAEDINAENITNAEDTILYKMKTFRYKFSSDIINETMYFGKLHQYDDRRTFKEAWEKWCNTPEIQTKIEKEISRLIATGATGDIMDKLYKSTRYYYRKKPNTESYPELKKRKNYIRFSDIIIKAMDNHIISECKSNIIESHTNNQLIHTIDISPAEAYAHFCENQTDKITKEVTLLLNKSSSSPDISWIELSHKFKKTYKNRYYIYVNKTKKI